MPPRLPGRRDRDRRGIDDAHGPRPASGRSAGAGPAPGVGPRRRGAPRAGPAGDPGLAVVADRPTPGLPRRADRPGVAVRRIRPRLGHDGRHLSRAGTLALAALAADSP